MNKKKPAIMHWLSRQLNQTGSPPIPLTPQSTNRQLPATTYYEPKTSYINEEEAASVSASTGAIVAAPSPRCSTTESALKAHNEIHPPSHHGLPKLPALEGSLVRTPDHIIALRSIAPRPGIEKPPSSVPTEDPTLRNDCGGSTPRENSGFKNEGPVWFDPVGSREVEGSQNYILDPPTTCSPFVSLWRPPGGDGLRIHAPCGAPHNSEGHAERSR